MHEKALLDDLLRAVLAVAETEDAVRVTRVTVRLGALSHFTPEHFREHFVDAARGTLAEGAAVVATLDADVRADGADGVLLESVEVAAAGAPPPGGGSAAPRRAR
jgi:hydrogenase nickel incorporation protein HypA/HybF